MLLSVKQRIPNTREYLPAVEVIWDTSQGPTIHNLQHTIEDFLFIPVEHVGMAKHFPKRFDWLIIKENQNKVCMNKKLYMITFCVNLILKKISYDP
jgi:ubiquitin carboxyl-terminal hydrolase 40